MSLNRSNQITVEEEDINDYIFSEHEDLNFHIHKNGIAEFRINRGKNLNTISKPFITESLRLLHIIETLEEVRLIVFWSGDQKSWSAGGDVVSLTQLRLKSLRNHPTAKIPVDEMLLPSPSPSSVYNVDYPTITTPQRLPTTTTNDGQNDQLLPLTPTLFSGHVDPHHPHNIPPSASQELKLNPVKGLDAMTLETDPKMKPLLDFFHAEYCLLSVLSSYSKPTLTLLSGISFGGGFGLAMSTSIRLASMNTRAAMPETKIGLFPDVGASYFYSTTPYGLPMGRFLGCSGYNLTAPELLKLGLISGIFAENQYHQTMSALCAVPKETLKAIFSNHLPQILMQYSQTVNTLHKDGMYLLKQQHKYQLHQLILLISTYISSPRDGRPSRLGLYIPINTTNYLAMNTNPSYVQIHTQIQQFLEQKSFLFSNLDIIMNIFSEQSYDAAVQKINNYVQFGNTPLPRIFPQAKESSKGYHPPVLVDDDEGCNEDQDHVLMDKSTTKANKAWKLSAQGLITTSCNLIDDKTIRCSQQLQKLLSTMCPASCILTYQMFSPIFQRVVASHKAAIQDHRQQDENKIDRFFEKLSQSDNTHATAIAPTHTYPIYVDYILKSERVHNFAHTPMILDRFVKPIHHQHYTSYFKKNLTTLTTPTTITYPTLTYMDYLAVEFILVARASLGDYSNFNFLSGVSAHLINPRHRAPRWHLFSDILHQYRHLISDIYPMDMKRGAQNLISPKDENNLFQEECWLLLHSLPLPFLCPDLTLDYRHFYPADTMKLEDLVVLTDSPQVLPSQEARL